MARVPHDCPCRAERGLQARIGSRSRNRAVAARCAAQQASTCTRCAMVAGHAAAMPRCSSAGSAHVGWAARALGTGLRVSCITYATAHGHSGTKQQLPKAPGGAPASEQVALSHALPDAPWGAPLSQRLCTAVLGPCASPTCASRACAHPSPCAATAARPCYPMTQRCPCASTRCSSGSCGRGRRSCCCMAA